MPNTMTNEDLMTRRLMRVWTATQVVWLAVIAIALMDKLLLVPSLALICPRILAIAAMIVWSGNPRRRKWAMLIDVIGSFLFLVPHLAMTTGLNSVALTRILESGSLAPWAFGTAVSTLMAHLWWKHGLSPEAAGTATPPRQPQVFYRPAWTVWFTCQAVLWGVFVLPFMHMGSGLGAAFAMMILMSVLGGRLVLAIATIAGTRICQGIKSQFGFVLLTADAVASLVFVVGVMAPNESSRTMAHFQSVQAAAFGIYCGPWLLAIGGELISIMIGTMAAIRGVPLKRTLQARGYDWLTTSQARELWRLCGELAFELPPWHEMQALPNVREGDMESIKAAMRLRKAVR